MNYELAKTLRDAGFPQAQPHYEGKDAWVDEENTHCNNIFGDAIYCPTLSELIEACGDIFSSLNKDISRRFGEFYCESTIPPGIRTGGSTPEEAVGRLYLTLHGKL